MPAFTLKLAPTLAVLLSACALALVLTPIVRALSARWGWLARPSGSRWHKRPTTFFGGVAIFLSVFGLAAPFLPDWICPCSTPTPRAS